MHFTESQIQKFIGLTRPYITLFPVTSLPSPTTVPLSEQGEIIFITLLFFELRFPRTNYVLASVSCYWSHGLENSYPKICVTITSPLSLLKYHLSGQSFANYRIRNSDHLSFTPQFSKTRHPFPCPPCLLSLLYLQPVDILCIHLHMIYFQSP